MLAGKPSARRGPLRERLRAAGVTQQTKTLLGFYQIVTHLRATLQFMRCVEADVFGDRPLLRAWDERYRVRPAAQSVLKW